MIALSTVIRAFEGNLRTCYGARLLPSHRHALAAMRECRTVHSARMQVQCTDCHKQRFVPHSCGHRSCPHCQHHECEQWLERQWARQVPGTYFMVTFTLPAQLRALAWAHQRTVYASLLRASWETLRSFSENDKQLKGTPGAIAVLHTHSRKLDYHPHVHVVMPAAAIDKTRNLWRTKATGKSSYLFSHKALAKVFRAKLLDALQAAKLTVPASCPPTWVVDCKAVGSGAKALVYLGRYLYRGVIAEKNILACKDGQVTFRYQDSKTKRWKTRTVAGADFLWLLMQHVLPRRFRRARNFGFLHPNAKRLIARVHALLKVDLSRAAAYFKPRPTLTCTDCGGIMQVIHRRLAPARIPPDRPPDGNRTCSVM
ncbi:MAG: transposase [Xanthomonadales bacterium]|nr:transposase [Xanthomonadales bacterium]